MRGGALLRISVPCCLLGVVVCLGASACAPAASRVESPAGSISSVVRADQYGLEVAKTTRDQARDEILSTPTVFDVTLDDDLYSWDRARFFLENYTGASSGHSSAVMKVVGSRLSLQSNPGLEGYQYEVSKDRGDNSFTYHVSCLSSPGGDVGQAALNAANLARFIRDGKLEVSLLQRQ